MKEKSWVDWLLLRCREVEHDGSDSFDLLLAVILSGKNPLCADPGDRVV
jgi:hypothetical protein